MRNLYHAEHKLNNYKRVSGEQLEQEWVNEREKYLLPVLIFFLVIFADLQHIIGHSFYLHIYNIYSIAHA